jgi:uncharacterized protein (UPF0276 family)
MWNAVASRAEISPRHVVGAGIGLRLPHLAEMATDGPSASWLEIHPENFLANQHAKYLLSKIAANCALSIHTVGISIGSVTGLDRDHLMRLRRFVDDLDPFLISGHLAWSTHGNVYLNDLLPLPYDEESLRVVASQLHQVQDALGRPYLIENPASYVGFGTSTLTEVQFLQELVKLTDCRLLCDISNIFLSGANMGFDPYAYIDNFPDGAVDELHLGGFTAERDHTQSGGNVLIDTHAAPIADPVWLLYAHALKRFGPKPTLIEWDNELPDLATLLREADRADAIAAQVANELESHVASG